MSLLFYLFIWILFHSHFCSVLKGKILELYIFETKLNLISCSASTLHKGRVTEDLLWCHPLLDFKYLKLLIFRVTKFLL